MILGNNKVDYLNDIRFNLSEDDITSMAKIKTFLNGNVNDKKNGRKFDVMRRSFESDILPSIYNRINGTPLTTSSFKQSDGTNVDTLKEVLIDQAYISELSKTKDNSVLSNILESFDEKYGVSKWLEERDKQNPGNKNSDVEKAKGESKKKLEKMLEDYEESKEQEEDETEKQKIDKRKEKEIDERIAKVNKELGSLSGYKDLEKWLDSIKKTSSTTTEMVQMTKMSDLRKVSISEFAKPRMLVLKRAVNREYYVRSKVEKDRSMFVCTDNSGSMGDFIGKRDGLLARVQSDCESKKINMYHTYFIQKLIGSEVHIKNKLDMYSNFNYSPGGGEDVERSVMEKLNMINKTSNTQYLLFVSDGTATIESTGVGRRIEKIAKEKNVDIKFALFSAQNTMNGISKENIFYVYGR